MPYTRERLGELLVAGGVVAPEQLDEALAAQVEHGGKLGEVLVERFGVSEDKIAETLARQKGLEHVSLFSYPVDREAVAQIPVRVARVQRVIPIDFRDAAIVLAMADPLDIEAVDEVAYRTGLPVMPVVATPSEILAAIEKFMASADVFQEVVEISAEAEEEAELVVTGEEDVPIVRLVNQLVREAILDRASDIHIEPADEGVRVRYRVDGVLREVMQLPRQARAGMTSRIKVMADMDIAERRLPQDGRTTVAVEGRQVDLRVASLPTPLGEALSIRILDEQLTFRDINELGMEAHSLEVVEELLEKPYGAILAAGPTGSGKTTTLYALLSRLNVPDRKIITVEDPVEYRMEGTTQMAVRPKIGLSFASGLRTILRADPDIIMVGEMRDPETAQIGVRAALTGHLVLSSIHTNDAPSALTRLVDMEVPSYITSSALVGVVAQRLARRLCDDCKENDTVRKSDLEAAGFTQPRPRGATFKKAVGCDRCSQTGYRGRIGVFEVLAVDEDLTRLFLEHAPAEQLREAAIERGMKSLREDALKKAASGVTSLEEVARVVA